jgi:hypothetical protein
MKAMVLTKIKTALEWKSLPIGNPDPARFE